MIASASEAPEHGSDGLTDNRVRRELCDASSEDNDTLQRAIFRR